MAQGIEDGLPGRVPATEEPQGLGGNYWPVGRCGRAAAAIEVGGAHESRSPGASDDSAALDQDAARRTQATAEHGGHDDRRVLPRTGQAGRLPGSEVDGEPGWITIWRGWQKLYLLVHGAELAETIT